MDASHKVIFSDKAVLVPIKAFSEAKQRLSSVLNPNERIELARFMAELVIQAAGDLPVAVVCDDLEVAAWSEAHGAAVLWEPGKGLNGAVDSGVGKLISEGANSVIVAHSDIPLVQNLAGLVGDFDGVTLVPDRYKDGTNVICVSDIAVTSTPGFKFSYGPGSFYRHFRYARSIGLEIRVVEDELAACDIDLPEDIELLQQI